MSEEVPGSSPVTSQNLPTTPSIDHYKSLVEMAEKGIGRIHDEYKRFIWALTVIVSVGIVVVGFFTYKTISDFKEEMRKEAEVTRSIIQRELDLHKGKAITELTDHLNKQIAEQFGTQRIQETLRKVATAEAKGLIEGQLNPAIDQAKETINNLQRNLRQDVNNIRANFEKELKDLRREVDFQKRLNEIQVLQSSAIAECDFEAFVKLNRYVNENNDLILAAKAAGYQVKGFYASTSRFRNENFSINLPEGSTKKLKDSTVSDLIQMLSNQDMQTRGVATFILSRHKECDIPETLLKVMKSDQSLCVRREALQSFEVLTSFRSVDVFDFLGAQKWYDENRDQVRKQFQCKDEGQ